MADFVFARPRETRGIQGCINRGRRVAADPDGRRDVADALGSRDPQEVHQPAQRASGDSARPTGITLAAKLGSDQLVVKTFWLRYCKQSIYRFNCGSWVNCGTSNDVTRTLQTLRGAAWNAFEFSGYTPTRATSGVK